MNLLKRFKRLAVLCDVWQKKPFKKSTCFCVVLLFMILFLQLLSQNLLMELALQNTLGNRHLSKLDKKIDHIINNIKRTINTTIISSNGVYQIIPNILRGNEQLNDNWSKVSLISHCTVAHLINIINIVQVWNGPVIVSVYTPRNEVSGVLLALFKLYKCHGPILQKLTVNLVTDYHHGNYISVPVLNKSENCYDTFYRKSLNNHIRNYGNSTYPNNLLRNVGIRTAKTSFIFIVDIDFIPSEQLFEALNEFLVAPFPAVMNRNISDMDVFVIPAFEIKPKYTMPENKRTLLKMIANGSVRPFYIEMCKRCQVSTRYNLWKASPLSDQLSVAYTVEWEDPWEPFYVAHKAVPLYDERFQQYGFNRISQTCELHIAGYQFHVLDNAFIVHQGFKTNHTFHSLKNSEQESNRLLFRKFKEELKIKYPNSKQSC